MPNLLLSPEFGQKSDGGISDFPISDQSFINKNCHKSRISHDIDIKFGVVTKLDKRNTSTSKNIDDDVMLVNCDVIAFFLLYGKFAAIRKPDSEFRVYKAYILINSNLLSYRT